jgi:hypothetical protein
MEAKIGETRKNVEGVNVNSLRRRYEQLKKEETETSTKASVVLWTKTA